MHRKPVENEGPDEIRQLGTRKKTEINAVNHWVGKGKSR